VRTVFYGDIEVDYTDAEYERLQAIKQRHYDCVSDEPLTNSPENGPRKQVNFKLSSTLLQRVKSMAADRNMSTSEYVRWVMEVLTS